MIVLKISQDLKCFDTLPIVQNLNQKLKVYQQELKKIVFEIFKDVFITSQFKEKEGLLNNSCLVLDILQNESKEMLCKWYIDQNLKDYIDLYQRNPEVSSLEEIQRRYQWLKRWLRLYDTEHFLAFPKHWKVDQLFTLEFCKFTREDLLKEMEMTESKGSFDTNQMLQAIQHSVELEEKLVQRYSGKKDILLHKGMLTRMFDGFLWHYIEMEDKIITKKFKYFEKNLGVIEDYCFQVSFYLSEPKLVFVPMFLIKKRKRIIL